MQIKQFYDESLAHASYIVENEGYIAVIDPARDPLPYFEYADNRKAEIVAVVETHPHADFVSSHLEISRKTGASVFISRLVGAGYPHKTFDSGDTIQLGSVVLTALNTPGHSPDSICIVVTDEQGINRAVFTGDTLFIGDVGRPDLREKAGNIMAKREKLARDMYRSTRNILMKLEKDVVIYPAHGAGSLCGKALSKELTSTIGKQLRENYALQEMTEDEFIRVLLEDQPFIPKYFGYNVAVNRAGAGNFEDNIKKVPRISENEPLVPGITVIDTRARNSFNEGHLPGAINIIEDGKFETWLGSIAGPDEPYYLVAENEEAIESVIRRSAKIGYEKNILGAFLNPPQGKKKSARLDLLAFKADPEKFTVVDVRNQSETKNDKIFRHAINIPLYELRERCREIPDTLPVVVYCAGGYRSAAAASIISHELEDTEVFDLGENIKDFKSTVISSLE